MSIRIRSLAAVLLLALVAAGCGSSTKNDTKASGGGGSTATSTPSSGTTASTASTGTTGKSGGGGTTLDAVVGKGDAFQIDIKQGGADVTTLKPGAYTINVDDQSAIHNFHLTGPGVDKMTQVGTKGTETWKVTLKAGTYTYICDPHASSMKGSFTVA